MNRKTGIRNEFDKKIFLSGEYINHFKPDDKWNPFRKIYKQKMEDTIGIINAPDKVKTILDVGGGKGRLTLALTKSAKNRVYLVDVSIDMLELAVKHRDGGKNIKAVNADANQLPYQNDLFDLVVGLDLFCHLERPEDALAEFYRVLKRDGILIIDSTNSNPLWTLFFPRYLGKNPLTWWRTMKFGGVLPGWQKIVKHYPKHYFLSFLEKSGFEVIRCLNYGPIVCPKWHMAISKKIV